QRSIALRPRPAREGCPDPVRAMRRLLGRRGCGLLARVVMVRENDDAEENSEHKASADYQPGERRGEVRTMLLRFHRLYSVAVSVTRTLFITSFCRICRTSSSPCVTLPNTVCTPFRCLVFFSSRTMKNWLPPVSFPACAIDSAPNSCVRGLPLVSHLIL